MMVIEGHSSGQSGRHSFRDVAFGPAVAGQTVYTATVALPTGETFAPGTAVPAAYYTIYAGNANVGSSSDPRGTSVTVNANGTVTATLAAAPVAGATIQIYFGVQIVIQDTDRHIFPADRCTWNQLNEPSGGYAIDGAFFWDGVSSAGVPIDNPRLGYIGKSGRFVEIAK